MRKGGFFLFCFLILGRPVDLPAQDEVAGAENFYSLPTLEVSPEIFKDEFLSHARDGKEPSIIGSSSRNRPLKQESKNIPPQDKSRSKWDFNYYRLGYPWASSSGNYSLLGGMIDLFVADFHGGGEGEAPDGEKNWGISAGYLHLDTHTKNSGRAMDWRLGGPFLGLNLRF